VLDKESEGDKETVPAPVTRYMTPLALATQVRLGGVILINSFGSKVMWLVAPESIIQPLSVPWLELRNA
jgi:hypothetical protein